MAKKAQLLQLSRKVHLYFGLLISPALVFFAFTGAFQTLGLHEPSANYKPPALLASLGQIHKKQTYVVPVRRSPGALEATRSQPAASGPAAMQADLPQHPRHDRENPAAADAPAGSAAQPRGEAQQGPPARTGGQPPLTLEAKQKQHLPLKIFFVLVSLGLLASTLTGIYMAYKYDRNKVLVTLLLLAGVVLPIVLVRF